MSHTTDTPPPSDASLLALAGFIAFLLGLKIYVIDWPRHAISAYRCLALVDDLQVLGPLLRAYANRDKDAAVRRWVIGKRRSESFYRDAVSALPRLLSKVDAVTDIDLSSKDRSYLRNLVFDSNTDLVLAALEALRRVGDSRDLVAVSKLCEGFYTAWENRKVHEAAGVCSAAIEKRIAEQTTIQTLLRASQPTSASDVLLRPVAENSEADWHMLLRAGRRPETELEGDFL
jgi:hypothetical protein